MKTVRSQFSSSTRYVKICRFYLDIKINLVIAHLWPRGMITYVVSRWIFNRKSTGRNRCNRKQNILRSRSHVRSRRKRRAPRLIDPITRQPLTRARPVRRNNTVKNNPRGSRKKYRLPSHKRGKVVFFGCRLGPHSRFIRQ